MVKIRRICIVNWCCALSSQYLSSMHSYNMWRICREYAERSIGKIISDIQPVPHACRVVSMTLHALEICETCHTWPHDLMNTCIGGIWWMLWICGECELVYVAWLC